MSNIIKLFMVRPVLTSVFCIFLLLIGLIGFFNMPFRFLPQMNQSFIQISTAYPGADSALVKNYITDKIQSALVGIDGLNYMTANSMTGISVISIYLQPDINVDAALENITSMVNSVRDDLPHDARSSVVSKQNLDDKPILILGFTSDTLSRNAVATLLKTVLEPQIEAIEGIQSAQVWSDSNAMQIFLNPTLLAAYHLSAQDVEKALQSQNVISASGTTRGNYFNYNVHANTQLLSSDEFNNVMIKSINSVPIRIKDVGYAASGTEQNDYMVYYDNKPATMMGITTLSNVNPLTIINQLKQQLPTLLKSLPSSVHMQVVLDRTIFIKDSLRELIYTLVESILIVVGIMYLFLGNFRAAIIPIVTIPLSLIGICFFLWLLGYTLNSISLLAMVLAVGLVVDDAIVVVENILRHCRNSSSFIQSAMSAINELMMPIIAMTLTVAVIYIPVGLCSGLMLQLFKEFAFTLAGSVMISGLVALIVSPLMCVRIFQNSRLLRHTENYSDRMLDVIQLFYKKIVAKVFRFRKIFFGLWVLIIVVMGILFFVIPSELVPSENQGFLLSLGDSPANANLSYLENYAVSADKIYKSFSGIKHNATVLSPEGYVAYLVGDRFQLSRQSFILQNKLEEVTGLDFHVISPSILPGANSTIQFVLQTSGSYKSLYYAAKNLEASALASGKFLYLYDDLHYSQPQANIVINKNAAILANVSMAEVSNTLSAFMSNRQVQQYSLNNQTYDVVIKTLADYQLNPEQLMNFPIVTLNHTTIPLSAIASIQYTVIPTSLNEFQRMNSVTIMGALAAGNTISQGLDAIHVAAKNLKNTMRLDYAGYSRQYLQEGKRMLIIFCLALVVIFLVLSIQFNSYRDSFIILLGSIPCALFAGLLPLADGLVSLNIFTEIGLLTLIGLMSKHGILITRFANEIKMVHNKSSEMSVIEASTLRLRPILMTTLAIVVGVIPLITASSQSRHAMGLVIGFGMSVGTVLTLLLLPLIYTFISRDVVQTQ